MVIIRKTLNIIIIAFLSFCIYTSFSIFIKNDKKEFDLDYFVKEYKLVCGNIDLKYETRGRSSSTYYFVLNNQEIRISAKKYYSYEIGEYKCIENQYSEPNGFAILGCSTMIVVLLVLIAKLLILIYEL